jgi:hypothetical protein
VDGLEKENKQLAEQLEQALKQREAAPVYADKDVAVKTSRATPNPTQPSSSAARTELDFLTKQELIAKYILKCDKYDAMKGAKEDAEKIAKKERQKVVDWNEYTNKQDSLIRRKNEKIKRQGEEIQRLRVRLNENDGELGVSFNGELNPSFSVDGNDVQISRTSPSGVQNAKSAGDDKIEPNDLDLPRFNLDLPRLDISIRDTSFEEIEAHNTSSTEGSSDPMIPNELEHEETTITDLFQINSSPSSVEITRTFKVKKRKTPGHTAETPAARRIKMEDLTSSPVGLTAFHSLNESIDLDDIGEKVDTPRKARRICELSRKASGLNSSSPRSTQSRSQSQSGSNSSQSTQPTSPILPSLKSREDIILQPRSTNKQILPRTSIDGNPKKRRVVSDQALAELLEDGEISITTPPEKAFASAREKLNDLLTKPTPAKNLLSPAKLARPIHQAQPGKPPIIPGFVQRDTIITLSSPQKRPSPVKEWIAPCVPASKYKEEGQGMIPRPSSPLGKAAQDATFLRLNSPRASAEPPKPSSNGRLDALEPPARSSARNSNKAFIDIPPPSIRMDEFFKKIQATTTPARQINGETNSFSRPSPGGSTGVSRPLQLTTTKKQQGRRSMNIFHDQDVNPEDEPLRVRSVETLTIQDFKVNPNYNHGHNYKYKEVVRGRDARRCLQGCTKAECCGHQWRALAEMSRNPDKPLTASQEEADELLLDEFLGDNAYKLRNMTAAEREEVLMQAKTRDLANKHGKHRQAYERRSSPEGFWRVDFPTTQEQEQDRARQKEKERDEIMKRYQEAMRPGGAYIFRDE